MIAISADTGMRTPWRSLSAVRRLSCLSFLFFKGFKKKQVLEPSNRASWSPMRVEQGVQLGIWDTLNFEIRPSEEVWCLCIENWVSLLKWVSSGRKFDLIGCKLWSRRRWGFVLQIIACIMAMQTYNLGATDFKNTEVFKEVIEFQTEGGGERSRLSAFDESNQEAPWGLWDFLYNAFWDVECM
jgi:hypothetical protein